MLNLRALAYFPLIASLLVPAQSQGQQPASPPTSPVSTIKAESRLVVVDVTAIDSHGNPVIGLSKDDFIGGTQYNSR